AEDGIRDGHVTGVQTCALPISASERVRKDVDKGFKQDLIFETVERVRAVGINVIANFIFGLPEDDLQSMQETLDMALELNCEFANFYCAMAYPGSRLYDQAVKDRCPLPTRWSDYSYLVVDTLLVYPSYLTAID